MKAEITPSVIQDLLPLYLAGEVSADTMVLVDEYLKTDPELAAIARQAGTNGLVREVPVPLRKEDAMETYRDAKRWMVVQTLGLAAVITFATLCIMTFLPVAYIALFR
jgi:hypothetical protein